MKRVKTLMGGIVLSFILFFGVIAVTPVVAEQGGSDPCCRNGYKTWKDPILFGGTNFKDCWCKDHKGKDMTACSCGVNGPGGETQ